MRIERLGAVRPVLALGIGNPSRGDDAIGPLLIEALADVQARGGLPDVALLADDQLLPEHVLDLRGRALVIFADAAASGPAPFALRPVVPATRFAHATHTSSPGELLALMASLYGTPPRAWVLAIRGFRFTLGDPLSPRARANLDSATDWLVQWDCRPPGPGPLDVGGSGSMPRSP
jgi:hydrogenase maturation protease